MKHDPKWSKMNYGFSRAHARLNLISEAVVWTRCWMKRSRAMIAVSDRYKRSLSASWRVWWMNVHTWPTSLVSCVLTGERSVSHKIRESSTQMWHRITVAMKWTKGAAKVRQKCSTNDIWSAKVPRSSSPTAMSNQTGISETTFFMLLIHAPCHLSSSGHQSHHRDPGQRGCLRPPDRGPQSAGHLAWLWSQISEWRTHQCIPV